MGWLPSGLFTSSTISARILSYGVSECEHRDIESIPCTGLKRQIERLLELFLSLLLQREAPIAAPCAGLSHLRGVLSRA